MHGIRTALYSLREFAVLEATNQRTVAIRTVIDIQEVIVWLNVEAKERYRKHRYGQGVGVCIQEVKQGDFLFSLVPLHQNIYTEQ